MSTGGMEPSRNSLAGDLILRLSSHGEDVSRRAEGELRPIGSSEATEAKRHGSRKQAATYLGQSSAGPAHRFGTTLSDIFAHSWRRILSTLWRWIPKRVCVWGGGDLGFVARERAKSVGWGLRARRVRRILDPPPLTRSYAEAVKGEMMDHGRRRYLRRFGGGGGI